MWLMYLVTVATCCGSIFAQGSTTGKEFVTGFLSYPFDTILKLDIASSGNGDVEVIVPYLGINATYSFNKTFSINVSTSLQLFGTLIGHNGVFIKSTVDVSVYVTTYRPGGTGEDTHVALPVKALGRAYHISSYTPNYSGTYYPSQLLVISPFGNTEVNISFPNGTSISKTLNWLDVYQEASPNSDLTGTIILSSKPVSVVSGASCSYVFQKNDCDMLGEQMIPTNAFRNNFIVPPIRSHQFMVRIFSSQSNNTVCVKNASFENCTTLRSKQWLESTPTSSALVVTSQEPISVIQYKESQSYMTLVPGIQQFMNSYSFVVPEVYSDHNNYLAVTIVSSAAQTLVLDGKQPRDQLVDTAHVEPPFNEYTVLTFRVTSGYHVMISTEAYVVFGLIVYGIGFNAAYGFPAGINFDYSTNEQLMCYSCDDMSDLQLCDTVQKCQPRELCMVQHGNSKYSSGCASSIACSDAQSSRDHCTECCDSDYCNGRGCGDKGLAPRSERGPICFDCSHVASVDQCKTVRPCYKGEFCSIEEFDWLGQSHFKLGCVTATCSALEHGRSVPRCKSCCIEDFCNTNCTMGHSAAIIG